MPIYTLLSSASVGVRARALMSDSPFMPERATDQPGPSNRSAPFPPMSPDAGPAEPAAARCSRMHLHRGDLAPLFMILAAMIVIFPLLSRQKMDHGPNDASRWNTVYYLLKHRTY